MQAIVYMHDVIVHYLVRNANLTNFCLLALSMHTFTYIFTYMNKIT